MTLATMTACCACVFLHLAYYLTGYYIRLLRHGPLFNSVSNTVKFVNGWVADGSNSATKTSAGYIRLYSVVYYPFLYFILIENSSIKTFSEFLRVKKSLRIFNVICKTSTQWNRIFSFPALFIISSKLPTLSFSVFNFIQGLILPNIVLSTLRWSMLINFLVDITFMAIVFMAADIPVQDVN